MGERVYMFPVVKGPWKPWFAWHPVKLECGQWTWLRSIERRWVHLVIFHNEYRRPTPTGKE